MHIQNSQINLSRMLCNEIGNTKFIFSFNNGMQHEKINNAIAIGEINLIAIC